MSKQEKKIIDVIDKLRPFLINDGGNIEFVKYENNFVYINNFCWLYQLKKHQPGAYITIRDL